jgi:hypothetical protein
MLFAVIDATGWAVIIGAVFLGLIQLATLFINHSREKAKIEREQKLEDAKIKREQDLADKVESVREQAERAAKLLKEDTLATSEKLKAVKNQAEEAAKLLVQSTSINAEKLDAMALVGEKTHALVNSAMAAQLKIAAVALRRIANDSKNVDDIAAAELAEKNLFDHQEKQKAADAAHPLVTVQVGLTRDK